jgi:hypothetical protein
MSNKQRALAMTCMVMVWGSAANIGIGLTSFYLGLPWVFALLATIWGVGPVRMLLASMVALCPLAIALSGDPPSSHIHYPGIGARVDVPSGWGYIRYEADETNVLMSPQNLQNMSEFSKPENVHTLTSPTSLTLARVETQHADLGQQYSAVLVDPQGVQYLIEEGELLSGVADGALGAPGLQGATHLQRTTLRWLGHLMYWPLVPLAPFLLF